MPNKGRPTPPKKNAVNEIEALRARLEEAEQTLEAIRSGQVDALLVTGEQGDRIYTLSGADQIYRIIVETMFEAAFTADADGTILFCNRQFAGLLRLSMEEIRGHSITQFVEMTHRPILDNLLVQSRSSSVKCMLPLTVPDGTVRYVQLAASPIDTENRNSICVVVNDLTDLEDSNRTVALLKIQRAELEKREVALRQSEERFRSVLDSTSDVIYRLNVRTGRYEYISPSCQTITGYSSDELMALDRDVSLTMIHPDDLPAVKAALAGLEETGEQMLEYRQRNKNGDYRWLTNHVHLVKDASGLALYRDGIIADTTLRREAADRLRVSEERYRKIIAQALEGVWIIDLDGRTTYANDRMAQLLGHTVDEMIGRSIFDFIRSDDIPRNRASWFRSKEFINGRQFEQSYYHKSGRQVWLLSNMIMIDGSEIIGMFSDITQRKMDEMVLLGSKEKFSTMFQATPFAMSLMSLPEGILWDVNQAWLDLFGVTWREEVVAKPYADLGILPELGPGGSILKTLTKNGTVRNAEITTRLKNDELRYLLVNMDPVVISERSFILVSMEDVTVRKKAEERINSLLTEKDLILQEVHHRIKNNISTMISILSLQADDFTDPAYVSAFQDAVNRMRSMMVLYEKLYQSVSFTEISVSRYFASLADEIVSNFPSRGEVTIIKNIDDFILDVKRAQPLGIIINELLTNIMKYAFVDKPRGTITLSIRLSGNTVLIVIQDDGNGIPESFDLDNAAGFGLKLVRLFLKQLNGTFRLERVQGTRITIELTR